MTYAKLINPTQIVYAPKTFTHNGRFIINPPPEILTDLGYLPFVKTDTPIEDNYYFTPFYEIENNQILQKWERHEIAERPELTTDDITEILAEQEYRICLLELGVNENDIQTM